MQDNYMLYLKEQKLIHLSLKINEKLGKILVVRKGTKIQKITPLKRSQGLRSKKKVIKKLETIQEESSFGTDSSFVDESIDVVEQSVEKLHPPTMKTNHRSILLNTPKNSSKSDTIDLTMGIKKTTKKTKFKFEIEDDSLDDVESIFSEMDKEQKIKTNKTPYQPIELFCQLTLGFYILGTFIFSCPEQLQKCSCDI